MDYWLRSLNKSLYAYDRELYAKKDNTGKVTVYRKAYTWESYQLGEKFTLTYGRPSDHYIFSLTDTWSMSGNKRDWGIEPVLKHLKRIDPWRDPSVCEKMIEQHEKSAKTREKDLKNKHEAFAYEMHRDFKKAFSDFNVSTLKK